MYRKPDGSIGHSFTRFINNAVPNLAADPNRDNDKPNLGQDILYEYQLVGNWLDAPFALSPTSFHVAGVIDNETHSRKAFEKLVKAGTLTITGRVDTRNLNGGKLAHQIGFVPVARQKRLVEMLFWWEEEVRRLEKLIAEEDELGRHIGAIESSMHDGSRVEVEQRQLVERLRFEREKLRMRIKQRPSDRRADVEDGTDQLYAEAETAGLKGIGTNANSGGDRLPDYDTVSRQ